jgi:hypothetical protein
LAFVGFSWAARRSSACCEGVGELDQHHAHVLRHGHDHLAVVLGLRLLAACEVDLGQLGDALDQQRHLVTEQLAHVLEVGVGVLDHVVHQSRGAGGGVELHAGADLGDARDGG